MSDTADVSNVRPLAIFTGYMVTAAALTATSITIVRNGASKRTEAHMSKRRLPMLIFGTLAAVSLATTWYHMFCFFQWSYNEWAKARSLSDPDALYLGEWLRDTALFKQAWASTLETAPRAWWSLQIFGFCANWSVMLAAQERRRSIPHVWIFMLLGQIVAISFASNVFFLAVLVHEQVTTSKFGNEDEKNGEDKAEPDLGETPVTSSVFWYDPIVAMTVGLAVNVPSKFGEPRFMMLLLAPHVLAFAPALLNKLLRTEVSPEALKKPSFITKLGSMAVILVWATKAVVDQGGSWELVLETLHEHPAVSSVGWDVICCWVSYTTWFFLGEA